MGCRSAAVTTGENIAKLERMARLQMERSHNLRGIAGVALSFSVPVRTACQRKPLRPDTLPDTVFCLRKIQKRIRTAHAREVTCVLILIRSIAGSKIWPAVSMFGVAIRTCVIKMPTPAFQCSGEPSVQNLSAAAESVARAARLPHRFDGSHFEAQKVRRPSMNWTGLIVCSLSGSVGCANWSSPMLRGNPI
jgi:hypothetical protein